MTNVQFESEEDNGGFHLRPVPPPKGFYQLFIKNGWAKNTEEAGKIMATIALVAALIAILYPFLFG